MNYFTTKSLFFVPSLTNDVKKSQKIEKFLYYLESSGVGKIIEELTIKTYDPYNLFAIILLGFAFGKGPLRESESLCKFDLRFIHVMQG